MAAERTPRIADQPAGTRRTRRRPGADRRATRRTSSHDRAACQFEEGRSRRPGLQPPARVAAFPGGFRRRTCASPRGVGRTDCPVGRATTGTRSDHVERTVHTGASSSGSAGASQSWVKAVALRLARDGACADSHVALPIVTSLYCFHPTASAPTVRLCFRRDRGSTRIFRSRGIQGPSRFQRRFASDPPPFRTCCRCGS